MTFGWAVRGLDGVGKAWLLGLGDPDGFEWLELGLLVFFTFLRHRQPSDQVLQPLLIDGLLLSLERHAVPFIRGVAELLQVPSRGLAGHGVFSWKRLQRGPHRGVRVIYSAVM